MQNSGPCHQKFYEAGPVNALYFKVQTSSPCPIEDKPVVQSCHQFPLKTQSISYPLLCDKPPSNSMLKAPSL